MFCGLLFFWGGGQLCANLLKKFDLITYLKKKKLSFHIKQIFKDGLILLLLLKKKLPDAAHTRSSSHTLCQVS